jgi:hypothetical protein
MKCICKNISTIYPFLVNDGILDITTLCIGKLCGLMVFKAQEDNLQNSYLLSGASTVIPRPLPFSESRWIIFLLPEELFRLLPPACNKHLSLHFKPEITSSGGTDY